MRDSVAMETGDQTVASTPAIDAAASRADEELGQRTVSETAGFGSTDGRERRTLWAILSFLFVVGIAVSTIMVRSERNEALDAVVKGAHDQARLATATVTGKQLTKPVTGSSYDKLAAKLWRPISSDGTIVGLTIWSSQGRILFSLNPSLVGKTPPEMRSLIMGFAKGSGSARVLDDQVRTFTPVPGATDGPVAVVEIDQPVAVVEAQMGDLWSTLRLASGLGLAVSLVLLVLAFVRPRRHVPASAQKGRHEGDAGAAMNAEGQPKEPPTDATTRTYEEIFGLQDELDQTVEQELDERVEQDGDLEVDPEADLEGDPEADPDAAEGDPEAMKSIRQWDEKYEDMVQEEMQTQELMRQRREEFKARAEAAALRVKKLEAEPDEAPPTPDLIARDDGRQD